MVSDGKNLRKSTPGTGDFTGVIGRIKVATGCKTQKDLARILGIQQSSVSDACRRQSIPAEWLLTLYEERGIDPIWVKYGYGSSTKATDPAWALRELSTEHLVREIIERFLPRESAEDVIEMILRKKDYPVDNTMESIRRLLTIIEILTYTTKEEELAKRGN